MSKYRGSEIYSRKAEEIALVLSEPDVDLWRLRELALSEGGLVNDDLRRAAWPKLVGLHDRLFEQLKQEEKVKEKKAPRGRSKASRPLNLPRPEPTRKPSRSSLTAETPDDTDDGSCSGSVGSTMSSRDKILAICDDFDQIERDVARCTWHLLTGTQRSVSMQMEHKRHKKVAKLIRRKQRRLANLINLTLQQSYPVTADKLRYYQGYHDVACVILSTLGGSTPVSTRNYSSLESMAACMGLDMPSAVLLQLSQSHFNDCMKANFQQLQTALRLSLFPLLALFDNEVHEHLLQAEMEPFFALSWVITWFSHDIRDTELVKRLFDAFMVGHPLLPVYVSVAMILHPVNREEILRTECDFSLLHQTLQGLPRNSSMVGWKYRPGDGYVSDDDPTDDETVGSGDDVLLETQVADLSFIQLDDTGTAAPDGVSIASNLSSLLGGASRVPFQELFDTALIYMQRMPPHELLGLSKRYYGADVVKNMLVDSPDISLLEPAPEWAVTLTAKADWVLQQRAKEHKRSTQTRRGRRNEKKRERSRSRSSSVRRRRGVPENELATSSIRENTDLTRGSVQEYLKNNVKSASVVAAGFGRWDGHARRKKRRQRNMMFAGAAAAALLAIFWGIRTGDVVNPGEAVVLEMPAELSSSSSSHSRPVPSIDSVVDSSGSRDGEMDIGLEEVIEHEEIREVVDDSSQATRSLDTVETPERETTVLSYEETLVVKTATDDENSKNRIGDALHSQRSARRGIAAVEPDDLRICVCGAPAEHAPSPWEGVTKNLDGLRKNVLLPKIQALKKATKHLARKAKEELHDLPRPKYDQFVSQMWLGAKQRRREVAFHLRKDGIIRTKLNVMKSALRIWIRLPAEFAERIKMLAPLLQKFIQDTRGRSARFLAQVRESLEDPDANRLAVLLKRVVHSLHAKSLLPRLQKVPFSSIHMVQKMCRSGGKWYKFESVPFFCKNP